MTRLPKQDRSRVFLGLLALWIGIELLYSSRWLAIRSILQEPIRTGPTPGSLAELLQRPRHEQPPRVWFAPYGSFPEPGYVESSFRTGVYDTFLAFPASGLASNYGAFKLGPADLLFSQASSQGLVQEARLAVDLGYQFFAVDLGAVDLSAKVVNLCKTVHHCQVSSDGYALFPLNRAHIAWIPALGLVHRRIKEFSQRAAGFRWAGVVLHPDQWFLPDGSDLVIKQGARPIARVWARALLGNALYLYWDGDLSVPVASRLHTRQRRIWLTLAPGLAGAAFCLQQPGKGACTPIRLSRHRPSREISPLLPVGQITTINTLAVYGDQGQAIQLNQFPLVPGSSVDRSVFGLEIE